MSSAVEDVSDAILQGGVVVVCVSKSKARGREEVKEVKAVQRERQARDKHSWREEADLPIVTKLWTGRCEWAVE